MTKTTINPDKLHFQFFIDEDLDIENLCLEFSRSNYLFEDNIKSNNDYVDERKIFHSGELIGILQLKYFRNKSFCKFKFMNKILYQSPDEVINFIKFLYSCKKFNDVDLCTIELPIDSNFNLLSRYRKSSKNKKLKIRKGYVSDHYGRDIDEYGNWVSNVLKDTNYIHHIKTGFKKNENDEIEKVIAEKIYFRIEDKKALLDKDQKNKRFYIKDYLVENGIDIDEDYYRFEMVVPNRRSFDVSDSVYYYNDRGERISRTKYVRATKIVNSYEPDSIFSPVPKNYLEAQSLLSEFYDKRIVRKTIDIEIEKLFDKDYLYSLFMYINDSKKLIYNVDEVVKLKYEEKDIKLKEVVLKKRKIEKKIKYDNDNQDIVQYVEDGLNILNKRGRLNDISFNKVMNELVNNLII